MAAHSRHTEPMHFDNLSTLFLDMDGTLLDLHFDFHFWNEYLPKRWSEIHAVEPDKAADHIAGLLRAHEGTLNWYCTDHWSECFDVDIMSLKSELTHLVGYREGTIDFLKHVADSHLHVVMLTNAHPDVVALKQEETGVLDTMDIVITSHQFGAPKEDEEFWLGVKNTLDYDPDKTLMVDDSVRVLNAARDYGTRYQVQVIAPSSRSAPVSPDGFPGVDNLMSLLPDHWHREETT